MDGKADVNFLVCCIENYTDKMIKNLERFGAKSGQPNLIPLYISFALSQKEYRHHDEGFITILTSTGEGRISWSCDGLIFSRRNCNTSAQNLESKNLRGINDQVPDIRLMPAKRWTLPIIFLHLNPHRWPCGLFLPILGQFYPNKYTTAEKALKRKQNEYFPEKAGKRTCMLGYSHPTRILEGPTSRQVPCDTLIFYPVRAFMDKIGYNALFLVLCHHLSGDAAPQVWSKFIGQLLIRWSCWTTLPAN